MIRPLGFVINDKMLKRAGLDYWDRLDVHEHMNVEAFYNYIEETASTTQQSEGVSPARSPRIFYATTKAQQKYTDVEYHDGDYIMFGPESAGIPEEILKQHPEDCIRIPMLPEERSLNLSNSVAIILYEALRQLDFKGLEGEGQLHRLKW